MTAMIIVAKAPLVSACSQPAAAGICQTSQSPLRPSPIGIQAYARCSTHVMGMSRVRQPRHLSRRQACSTQAASATTPATRVPGAARSTASTASTAAIAIRSTQPNEAMRASGLRLRNALPVNAGTMRPPMSVSMSSTVSTARAVLATSWWKPRCGR